MTFALAFRRASWKHVAQAAGDEEQGGFIEGFGVEIIEVGAEASDA